MLLALVRAFVYVLKRKKRMHSAFNATVPNVDPDDAFMRELNALINDVPDFSLPNHEGLWNDSLADAVEQGEVDVNDPAAQDPFGTTEINPDLGFEQEMTEPSWFSRNIGRNKPKATGQEPEFGIGGEDIEDYGMYIEANENVESKPLFEGLEVKNVEESKPLNYVEQQEALADGGPLLEDLTQLEELVKFANPGAPSGRPLQDLTVEQMDQLEQKVTGTRMGLRVSRRARTVPR
jgi:hypothetical protein